MKRDYQLSWNVTFLCKIVTHSVCANLICFTVQWMVCTASCVSATSKSRLGHFTLVKRKFSIEIKKKNLNKMSHWQLSFIWDVTRFKDICTRHYRYAPGDLAWHLQGQGEGLLFACSHRALTQWQGNTLVTTARRAEFSLYLSDPSFIFFSWKRTK